MGSLNRDVRRRLGVRGWTGMALRGMLLAGLCTGALGMGAAAASAAPETAVMAKPQVPQGATSLGAVSSSSTISGDVGLNLRRPAALSAYASEASTPGSAEYHHYLSLQTFNAEYAPTTATVQAIESDLRAGGLTVGSVSPDNLIVSFSGSAAEVASAFHTTFGRFRLHGGRTAFANTAPAQLPASVASEVQSVTGLNNLVLPQAVPPAAGTGKSTGSASPQVTPPSGAAKACAAAKNIATMDSALTADNVAYAYGLDPLYSAGDFGSGQKIDILDLFGYNQSDLEGFDNCYYGATEGAQVLSRLSSTNVDGGAQTDPGDGGTVETEIDTESVAAYAPQAQADVFEAPNTDTGFLDDIAAMTNDTASKIETISYGECEPQLQAEDPGYEQLENSLFEQAAVEGKTVFASTADNGSDTCSNDSGAPVPPLLSASDPASQPYVTAVGGTAITAATDPPSEEVWNDGADGGGGGGGISDFWEEPSWQADSLVPGISNGTVIGSAENVAGNDFCQSGSSYTTACRELPDVSAQASPNTGGFPVYVDGGWNVYGGTSLASPTWAAILADINSTPSCVAGGGVGFVSPALYSIGSSPSEYAASFNDITTGNNDIFGVANGLFPATTGYDMATGLGSPKVTGAGGANGLAYYLCAPPAAAAPTVSSVTPGAISSASLNKGASLTVSGSGFMVNGTSDVAGVTIGTVQVPASAISVTSSGQLVVDPVPAALSQTGDGGTGTGDGTYDVVVTITGGASSAPGPNATVVLYGSGTKPVVDGTEPSAGVQAGGSTVRIYGAGFAEQPVTAVTFGGVAAQSYSVVNDNEITAVTPAYSGGTTSCGSSDDPSTGTCQVQVRVTTTTGSSPEPAIPAEYAGPLSSATATGTYPAPNEFDYEPPPHITSVDYASAPDPISNGGGTVVTINGTGFGALGLDWVNVGPYQSDDSEVIPSSVSSTQLTIVLPPESPPAPLPPAPPPPPPTTVFDLPVTVQTAGSPNQAPGVVLTSTPPSNAVNLAFAPTPSVTGVSTSIASGILAGPTSGGTPITLTGEGFDGAQTVEFVDGKYGFDSTQSDFTVVSNQEITLNTPGALTGVYGIEVCGVSGCSPPSASTFTFYVPGDPSVTSVKPATGSAGTRVVITGENLGYIAAVYFGSTPATTFHNGPTFFEGGDTTKVIAFAPAGTSGKTVNVRVKTLESEATGSGKSPVNPQATFTYK